MSRVDFQSPLQLGSESSWQSPLHSRDYLLLLVTEIKTYPKATYCSRTSKKLASPIVDRMATLEAIHN